MIDFILFLILAIVCIVIMNIIWWIGIGILIGIGIKFLNSFLK